jgi:hypothetical protein
LAAAAEWAPAGEPERGAVAADAAPAAEASPGSEASDAAAEGALAAEEPAAPDGDARSRGWRRRLAALGDGVDAALAVIEPVAMPVLWFAAVILIAFGAAGLVAGVDHPAGTIGRAELTWDADRTVTPAMDSAARDIVALSAKVDELGEEGRRILMGLADRDLESVNAGIASGSTLITGISQEASSIRGQLAVLPGDEPFAKLRISQGQLARHEVAVQAVDATRGLDVAWARLTAGATTATRLVGLLQDHDTTMGHAAEQGLNKAYADAIVTIDAAKALLDSATMLRDQLANTTDVGILDQWLRRNRTYDEALEALYAAFVASHGLVTVEVAQAFQLHEAARAQLPPDTRGLELIMAGITQGGLNQAVAAIEQAGEQLAHALDAMPDS